MSENFIIYKNLFNKDTLSDIKKYYFELYQNNKQSIDSIFQSGINKKDFYPGYYFLIYNKENDSYLKETGALNKDLQKYTNNDYIELNQNQTLYKRIKFNYPDSKEYQYAYVIDVTKFTEKQNMIKDIIDIMSNKQFLISTNSVSLTIQENGHTIHEHKDGGVSGRYHVVLNNDISDYFYIDNIGHKLSFGDCIYINTSKVNHTYMHFSNKIRMHLIFDVV